jgi:Protein of unknown function (DUF4199)
MKTSLCYGFLIALAGFLLRLIGFITGLESDPAHPGAGRWIGGLVGLIVTIVILVLGIKAKRAARPPDQEFTYGQAYGAGMVIQVWACFSIFTTYFYLQVINPHFVDLMIQANRDKMEARGMAEDQIERGEHIMRFFVSPAAQAVETFFIGLIIAAIITLIVAAFLRRPGAHDPLPA